MKIVRKIKTMQKLSESLRLEGKIIGVVPTMGYLHQGHLSLLNLARKKCDILVITIFVNPAQFAPNEDLDKYPRDFQRDKKLAKDSGVDIIFYPEVGDMYPKGYETFVCNEKTSKILEGEIRPGHYKGVTTIVSKLFNITKPHFAVFGQKDYQQALIIKKMVDDLNFDLKIIIASIVRDEDGLALSSRNIYLNEPERHDSTILVSTLEYAAELIKSGDCNCIDLIKKMEQFIHSKENVKIDYIKIVESSSLKEVVEIHKGLSIIILLAAKIGNTRLIDNKIFEIH